MTMYSPPLREFKKKFGQSNHFLITTLVGLDAVKDGIANKKDEFSTCWNPLDVEQSAMRSRGFILGLFMNSAVDSLSYYMNRLEESGLLESEVKDIVKDNSIKTIVVLVGKHYSIDPLLIALARLTISIRNSFIHYHVKFDIGNEWKGVLRGNQKRVADEYCGLEINKFINSKKIDNVTFKEVASLITATHQYVYAIDGCVLDRVGKVDCYEKKFKEMMRHESFKRKVNNKDFKKKSILIKNTFMNQGLVIGDEIAKELLLGIEE